jgi:hypothetical protein
VTTSVPVAPARAMDPAERLFWTLMRRFEVLALERYVATIPALATEAKRVFVETMVAMDGDEAALAGHELAAPTEALLSAARSPDDLATLIVQGLVLERLGQAIYGIVATTERGVRESSRELAGAGHAASATVTALVPQHLGARTDDVTLWSSFADASYEVVAALDGLADPIDRTFGDRFGLRFADVMGEFTADLISACTELGMPRRKVVAHLAGAAMGI